MEQEKNTNKEQPNEKDKGSNKTGFEHDVTVMMNEPIKITLPYGERLSDLRKKAEQELAKSGKTLNLNEYDCMLNNKQVKQGEDPILTRASVISFVHRNITGGTN